MLTSITNDEDSSTQVDGVESVNKTEVLTIGNTNSCAGAIFRLDPPNPLPVDRVCRDREFFMTEDSLGKRECNISILRAVGNKSGWGIRNFEIGLSQ